MNTAQLEHLRDLLQNENAAFEILHDDLSLDTASAGAAHYGITLQETTPTLILKVNGTYIAAIICGNTRISFKKLKQALNVKEVKMADPQEIFNITGARIGHVSLINSGLKTIIDIYVLKNNNCYGGSGTPLSTLRINTQDLIRITKAEILDFAETSS